jgi:hypothetical protein
VTTQQLPQPTAQQEQEFVNQLNNEGKAQYQTLDPQARALAVKLGSQYQDKNEAVKVAIQRIATKRAQY